MLRPERQIAPTPTLGAGPRQDKLGFGRKGIQHKNGEDDGGEGNDSPDGVVSSWIVGASASVIFHLHNKTQMASTTQWCHHEWVTVSSGTGSLG